jgi:hypothetical protein
MNFYQTTLRHVAEDNSLYSQHSENLGHAVGQLVEALQVCYKPEDRGLDSR